jgi:hypothetical protein
MFDLILVFNGSLGNGKDRTNRQFFKKVAMPFVPRTGDKIALVDDDCLLDGAGLSISCVYWFESSGEVRLGLEDFTFDDESHMVDVCNWLVASGWDSHR